MEYMDYGSLHGMLEACGWLPEAVITDIHSGTLGAQRIKILHGMQIVTETLKFQSTYQ